MNEHEFEPIKGLPAALPEGEQLIWQGSPAWKSLAIRAFHVRKIAIYFLLLITLSVATSVLSNSSLSDAFPSVQMLVVFGILTIGILIALAKSFSHSTVYTITNERIVLRIGVAVQMMINIPWSKIESVGVREFADGTGDVLIDINSDQKVSYWVLWPHARPWHWIKAQPLLRSLVDASTAGAHMARFLQQHVEAQSQVQSSPQNNSATPQSPVASHA